MASQYDILPSWQYFTAFHTGRKAVCEDCPQRPYLSLKVPCIPDNHVFVRRAVFTTISHDQGWATFHPELNGTYKETWTYFEVRVVDSTGRDRIPREVTTQNVRASSEPKKHVVCWDFRDDKYWLLGEEYKEAPTSHSGITPSKWLAALQAGDIIQTVPRAEFRAWVNNIVEASIEIWIELVPERSHPKFVYAKDTYETYTPLQIALKEIRLVSIEPSNNQSAFDDDEPPHLKLKYTNLAEPNHDQYEALSYCWGDGLTTSPILLTSSGEYPPKEVQISTNLRNALKRLRQPDRARTFWVDLLCINQLDQEEKSHQVALMGEIYASANSLSVWLGELEDGHFHTQSDFAVWQNIATTCEKNPAESHGNAGLWHDRVFLRPWFQRVWVVQEVWNALSSRLDQDNDKHGPISVLCGHLKLPWWLVVQANICLFHNFPQRRNWSMPMLWMELLNVARDRHTPQHVTAGPRPDILSIVIKGLDMKASDPRDRIFALLVFGKETHRIAELPDLVRPNYAKTPEQVYTDFTIWWIKENQSLRILSAVHTLRHRTWMDLSDIASHSVDSNSWLDTPHRPSWTLWTDGNSRWERGTLALGEIADYSACGNHRIDIDLLEADMTIENQYSINWSIPAFKGVQIGSIASFAPILLSDSVLAQSHEMLKAYLRVFDPTGHQLTWNNSTGAPRVALDVSWAKLLEEYIGPHVNTHLDKNLQDPVMLPCIQNCVFKTESGDVGLCPAPARVGDLVVILYGGAVPYLLRPKDSSGFHTFVGECYLEGFMKGEAFASEDHAFEEKVFRLV